MKIQSLAIIFIIIILPISLILSTYTKTRVETLNYQTEYDNKLNSSTYDAIKAYQVNSFENKTGDFTNSKIRDIKASVNTFFNSLQSNFATLGYTKSSLQNYVPAIVYTMYDGYYIYTPFTNTWDTADFNDKTVDDGIKGEMQEQIEPDDDHKQTKYKNGEDLYGLKPYVFYSCRYKKDGYGIDVVITYSLDNYIQIQGTINGNAVSKYGYVLNTKNNNFRINADGNVYYEGVNIGTETLYENVSYKEQKVGDTEEKQYITSYPYIKRNGVKYYYGDIVIDGATQNTIFYVSNGKKIAQSTLNDLGVSEETIRNNDSAKKYYQEANNMINFITTNHLDELTVDDIVDIDTGLTYASEGKTNPFNKSTSSNGRIFDFNCAEDDGIESEKSNFNEHRKEVIKYAIERNLSIVIANFDKEAGVSTEYKLPKLTDTDWDKIMDNIGIITFLQGMSIGGKIYNGYSVITNNKNEDVVNYDSIYIRTGINTNPNDENAEFHRITENNLINILNGNSIGIFNGNIERRVVDDTNLNSGYYFPVYAKLSYSSVVTQTGTGKDSEQTIKQYLNDKYDLKKLVYTALARERYGVYRPKLEI